MSAGSSLFLELRNGRTVEFVLADKPEVTLEGNQLFVSSETTQATYARSEVSYFHFAESVDGIGDARMNKLKIVHLDNTVLISGLTESEHAISVFDMNGRKCPVDVSIVGSSATINFELVVRGAYIIKIGKEQTIKIVKK